MDRKTLDEAINLVASYAGNVNDWMIIKKELLKTLSSHDRMYFSTRDPKTKEQSMNQFEKIVAEKWYNKTGVYPILIGHNNEKK
jgi:hypothetical protein